MRVGVIVYTCQGGGPADGALYSAVKASPSTRAGHPAALHTSAIFCSVAASVTRVAEPSATRSKSRVATEMTHAGFAARFCDLRVPGPDVNQNAPSTHPAPSGMTCGV